MQITYNGTPYTVKIDTANERKYIKVYKQGEVAPILGTTLSLNITVKRIKEYVLSRLNQLNYEDKKPLFKP